MVDRRHLVPRPLSTRTSNRDVQPPGHRSSLSKDEEEEYQWRLLQRWKHDVDDYPAVGPQGSDEQDRVLIDDYEPRQVS
jgi:enhancer of polycomb-like protein